MTAPVMLRSDLPGKAHEGKVRELYDLGDDRLLMVATDRISTYDVVMPTGVPRKGEVLTRLSAHWFGRTADVVPNHMISVVEADDVLDLGGTSVTAGEAGLAGRSMIVRKAEPLLVECVVRGYITGSGGVSTSAPARCAAWCCRGASSSRNSSSTRSSPPPPRPRPATTCR